ncbi:MAG: penicillin-binding protein [Actinobacteria bacterium]|nr:penicillin-binding protein [Actinomycetota bacterium]
MRTRKPVPVHNLKVTRKGKIKKRSILWRMRRVFYLAVLVLMVGASGLVYVLGQIDLPVDPRVATTQKQTSFICAADVQVNCNAANAMAQLHGSEDRVLVTWEQIPPVLWEAVVSAEDRDFFEHGGVDPLGIARAAYQDIKGGARQGGSTITQQYVKQEYLSSEQTVTRKIKEAVMAVKLEQEISKEEILTRYLNTVYFGRGAYGVQAASRTWFGHDVEALNAGEAAFLAGLLRNPNSADPYRGAKSLAEAERRRTVVLEAMGEEEYLTEAQVAEFEAVPMDPDDPDVAAADRFVIPPPTPSTLGSHVKGEEYGSEYFAEYVRQWLVRKYGSDTVLGGGLKVYTTLDLKLQKLAYDTVTTTLNRDGDPSAAIVSLDDQGHILAMMAGTDIEKQAVNLVTGAGGSGRQAGSTFKMFALAEAVREGYTIESVVPAPTQAEFGPPECGEKWEPKGGPGNTQSLVSATKNSVNTAYAELMVTLGPDKVAAMAEEMGVASIEGERPECSWVLGSAQVNPLEMAAAYSVIANRGVYKAPTGVTRVEFPDGRVDTFTDDGTEVLTPDQADRVRYSLEQVIDGGTGRAADIGRPAAGKTGTTQNNWDAWFIGFTPNVTTAVWMGYPQGSISMDDVHGIKVQGGTFPAEMWQQYMSQAVADTPAVEFPEVDPNVLRAGEVLFPELGRTQVVASGNTSGDNGGVPTATTAPPATTPQSTVPQTPQTTVPATTAPPATTTPPTPTTSTPSTDGGDGEDG